MGSRQRGHERRARQCPGNFGDCVPGGQANGCNTVNNGTIKSDGWTYQSKISGTPANTIYAGGAMEGGVDLSSLGLTGCFSTFLAETRSSPEVGAQLKDFLIGKFEACASALTTTPKDGNGDPIPDGGLSIGTGTVTAKDSADLDVTGAEEWKGKFDYYLCGPVSTDGCEPTSGNTGGVHVGPTQNVDQDNPPTLSAAATITEVGRYCWRGVFTSETQGVDSQTDDSSDECFDVNPVTPTLTTTAVEPFVGLSPTIIDGLADLTGDGVVNGDDDSSAFYGDTSIIDGHLDCDGWTSDNDGAAGDGEINGVNGSDDCTLIGVPSVTIDVVGGEFQTADGPLPKVFNAAQPNNTDIGDSDFAWSTIDGKVDSNGNEAIGGTDCSFNVIGDADILGNDASCGSGGSNPNFTNGKVDLNGDGKITSDDSCTDGCFLGHDVANGLIVNGTIPFGQALYDIATLTGTATQPGSGGPSTTYPSINPTVPGAPADGTITFTLVGPDGQTTDCTTLAQSDNAPPDVNPEDVGVSGDGDYQTSGFTPDAPGDYHWKASYTGSPPADPGPPPVSPLNTLGTSHNDDCTEAGENVTVEQIPTSIATRQRVYPNDAAQIASTKAGDNLPSGGTVTFRLYEAGGGNTALQNCQAHGTTLGSGGLIYEEPVDVTGGQHSENVSTSNTSRPVAANATVYWWVTYNTGDSAHTGRQSNCQENTSVTFVNDAGPGTLFSP